MTADDADHADRTQAGLAAEAKARNASVHMPRIGCGLAGGHWDLAERIIEWTPYKDGITGRSEEWFASPFRFPTVPFPGYKLRITRGG